MASRQGDRGAAAVPQSLAGVSAAAKATVEAQAVLFGGGGAYNEHQTPGYQVIKVFSRQADGQVVTLEHAPAS